MNKSMIFETELNFIKNEELMVFISEMIDRLPDYFFEIPASSTGKYHPSYTLGKGGLVKHTKSAVRIAKELFNNNTIQTFTDSEKDIIIASLLLHDGLKNGLNHNRYTIATHPLEMVRFIEEQKDLIQTIPQEDLKNICRCIATHMGEWNRDYRTGEIILPKPNYKTEKFVHLCDYLASRKLIEVNFEV